MQSKLTRANGSGWMMAGPAVFMMVCFILIPFVLAIGFSFSNQRLVSPNPTEFVGWDNYRNLLSVNTLTLEPTRDAAGDVVLDASGELSYPKVRSYTRKNPDYKHLKGMREWFRLSFGDSAYVVLARDVVFMKALTNTIVFVLVVAPLQGAIALCLALLINQPLRGITFFRAVYFMPVVVSIVVVSLLWRFIYAAGPDGLLNSMLHTLSFGSISPRDWIGSPDTALGSIIGMSIWQAVGFHMIIWLSGLQTISPTLYEAADIEGVSSWQRFRYVTWPGLRNTAVLVLIVITMQAFALFAQIDVMTKGGPLDSTQTMVFQAVERGYGKQDISGGASISVILFLIVLSISVLQRYLTREKK